MVDQFERNNSAGRMAYLGWALITIGGGYSKRCEGKTDHGAEQRQTDVAWMDLGLFFGWAPVWDVHGFCGLARAAHYARQESAQESMAGSIIIVALNGFGAVVVAWTMSPADRWRFVLGLTTIANVALAVLLIAKAYRQHQYGVMGLFALNIVIVFC